MPGPTPAAFDGTPGILQQRARTRHLLVGLALQLLRPVHELRARLYERPRHPHHLEPDGAQFVAAQIFAEPQGR
jgi:hypothetical protein